MNTKKITDEQLEFVVTLFLGMFGGHKFMKKDFKMGFIYLFTAGLFGIGWIIDIVKCLGKGVKNSVSNYDSLMGRETIEAINSGRVPNIQGTNLNLATGETCCYMDKAYTFFEKTITTGYTGKRNGLNKNNISKYYKNIVKETKQDKQFLYGVNPKYKNQENTLLEMFGRCDSFNKNIKI